MLSMTFLDLSKIEAGETKLVDSDIEIHKLFDFSIKLIEVRAAEKYHSLRIEAPADGIRLRADERMVRQMLLNLLSNAVKFTPQGGKITVSAEASKKNTTLKIADTGKGIPANKLPKLTDPFTRVGGDPYLAEPGWGLGLTITKSLVDLHDGTLDIKSIVGKGTTVTVTLPNAA